MAVEIEGFLTRVIVAFDRASALEGESHREAFLAAFERVCTVARPFLGEAQQIELHSRVPVHSKVFRIPEKNRKKYVQTITPADFWARLQQVAGDLYASDVTEVEISFLSGNHWKLLVAMDPVYFSFEPMKDVHG